MLPAETAIRAWVNGNPRLAGEGRPLANGAYLREQRSPQSGCYAVLAAAGRGADPVAETDGALAAVTVAALVYGGTDQSAEAAAVAYATEVEALTGLPARCGDQPYLILVADKITGPVHVAQPADSGELYCFHVSAEFMIAAA